MAKMGYKAGQGLGAGGGGRAAPIEVDLKGTKAGLGVDEARKRRQAEVDAMREEQGVLLHSDLIHGRKHRRDLATSSMKLAHPSILAPLARFVHPLPHTHNCT